MALVAKTTAIRVRTVTSLSDQAPQDALREGVIAELSGGPLGFSMGACVSNLFALLLCLSNNGNMTGSVRKWRLNF